MWHGPGQKYSTGTIANGDSLSDAIDIGGFSPSAIIVPVGFVGSLISWQVSDSLAGAYVDLYDGASPPNEVVDGILAGKAIGLSPSTISWLKGVRFVRVRAGSVVSPQSQNAPRQVVLCTHFF